MVHRILTSLIVFMLLGIWSMCEAGPPKASNVKGAVSMIESVAGLAFDYYQHPAETKEYFSIVAVVLVVICVISVVIMLIKYVFEGLWKLIKFISLGLVVHLPRKFWKEKLFFPFLWRKKLFIPALWASIFKIPWLLQVKKFRRPDIWASNIPFGLLIINLILWAVDAALCVLCLHYDCRFLFLLAPMLILTYYLYVGVYWARIATIVLLVLASPACSIIFRFRESGSIAMIFGNLVLIVLTLLPKSNAWFRKQNGEADTTGSGMIATVNTDSLHDKARRKGCQE